MKNTPKQGQLTFLIVSHNEWGFLGMCKELGLIETGPTIQDVEKKLLEGAKLVLSTVAKNPQYAGMLNTGLPLKYSLLFRYYVLMASTHSLRNFELFAREPSQLLPMYA